MKCRSVEILSAAVVLFVSASPVMAVIDFNDGLTHNIDNYINDNVWVDYESPGLETTLNILDGARVPYHVKGWEDSIINMFGGSVSWLDAYDRSQVTVSGGLIYGRLHARNSSRVTDSGGWVDSLIALDSSQVAISGGSMYDLRAYDNSQVAFSSGSTRGNLYAAGSSQVAVSGGTINSRLYAYGSSQVTVSGGSIKGYLWADDSSQVAVSGGSMQALDAQGSSQVTVSGGSMYYLAAAGSSQVDVSGGLIGGELMAYNDAILTIHGLDFAVDGMPFGYGELTSILGGDYWDEPTRHLAGILASGHSLDNDFYIGNTAKIVLVPEPATLLLLGLGGLALLRKRKF